MADEADISQAESDFLLSLHLNKRTQYQGESAEYCTGCGEVIPAVRCRVCGIVFSVRNTVSEPAPADPVLR